MNDLEFEEKLNSTLNSVHASQALKQRLLDPEALELNSNKQQANALPDTAANDSWFFWTRKALPVAACLLVAIGVALVSWPSAQTDLEREILAHIYEESFFLEAQAIIPLSEINQTVDGTLGVQFQQTPEMNQLVVHMTTECWVAKEDAIHMIMEGNQGAVSVLLIPNTPIDEEISISDGRFVGIITPTSSGNLIVVGEKSEDISAYSTLLASNINW